MTRKRRSREFRRNSSVINIDEARESRREKQKKEEEKIQKKKSKRKKDSFCAEKNTKPKKARKKINKAVVLVIAILIALFIGATYKLIDVKLEEIALKKENERLIREKLQIEEELVDADSPMSIEKKARERLEMIMPGELVFVVPEEE